MMEMQKLQELIYYQKINVSDAALLAASSTPV
jgi:hypothetical protein